MCDVMEAKRRRHLEEEVVTWAESCWESKTRHGQGDWQQKLL